MKILASLNQPECAEILEICKNNLVCLIDEMVIVLSADDTEYSPSFYRDHTFYSNKLNPEKLISISKCKAILALDKFTRLDKQEEKVDLDFSMDSVLKATNKKQGSVLSKTEYLYPFPISVIVVESSAWKVTTETSYFKLFGLPALPSMNNIPVLPSMIESGIDGVFKVAQLANLKLSHTEVPIPDCQDPEFQQLIELLKNPKSVSLCTLIQRYSITFGQISFNNTKTKLDAVAKVLFPLLEEFKQRLETLEHVDSMYVNEHVDGLESYLIALHYNRIFYRNLRFEYEQDVSFNRRLVMLDLYNYKTEFQTVTPVLLQDSMALMLEFEEATTPIRKLDILSVFFNLVTDYLKSTNQQADADQFLSLVIYLIMRYHSLTRIKPAKLIPSVEFCSQLRFPKHIRGQHAYCVVSMQAAIQYINSIDLKELKVPSNVIGYIHKKDKGQKRDHVLHETFVSNELENAAHLFSNMVWGKGAKKESNITERLRQKTQ